MIRRGDGRRCSPPRRMVGRVCGGEVGIVGTVVGCGIGIGTIGFTFVPTPGIMPFAGRKGCGTGFWIAWLSTASLKLSVATWPSLVIVTFVSPTRSDHWMFGMA